MKNIDNWEVNISGYCSHVISVIEKKTLKKIGDLTRTRLVTRTWLATRTWLVRRVNSIKRTQENLVGWMVQNSQSLYSFTFKVFIIVIHDYIYSHSITKFIFKKHTHSHLTTYFLFTNIFTHIYRMYSFTLNGSYLLTFTIKTLVQHGKIFIQHFLSTAFAYHHVPASAL